MSFVSLNPEDFVISSDSVVSTLWSNNIPTLTGFNTSSINIPSNNSYLPVYGGSTPPTSEDTPQFFISYGRLDGSGSSPINPLVPENTLTRVIYGQYRTLINGDEETNLNFGAGNNNSDDLYVININRTNYKEKLFLNTFNLELSGSTEIRLTINNNDNTTITYCDAGRVYDIVSGSNGTTTTSILPSGSAALGYTDSGSYGKFLPDVGLIILNPRALSLTPEFGGVGLSIELNKTTSALGNNNKALFNLIKNGGLFSLNSEETISSNYMFLRARNSDFNYTSNPSIINDSGELYYPSLVNNPETFITTVGMYNDNNELLAVAKLSKPLSKNFTKEALIRVKLDF
jgi:hypothetical protein